MVDSFPSSSHTRKLKNKTYTEEKEEEDDDSDMEGGGRASDEGMLDKKGVWKTEEDEIVLEHVRKHGPCNWSLIPSSGLLARPGKACRTRWTNKLNPNLKKEPLSDYEKRTILQMQGEIGNKWTKIACSLPGRTDNDVKNFWMGRQKRLARIQRQSELRPKRVARSSKTPSQQKLPRSKKQKSSPAEEHNGASNRKFPDLGHIKSRGVSIDSKPYKDKTSKSKSEESSIVNGPEDFIQLSGQQINHSLVESVSNQNKPHCREEPLTEFSYNSPDQHRTRPLLPGSNRKKQFLPSNPQYTEDFFTRNSSNMEHNPPQQFPSNGQQPGNCTGKQSFTSNSPLLEPPFFDFPSLPPTGMLQEMLSQDVTLHLPEKFLSYRINVDKQERMSMGDVFSDNMDCFLNNVVDIVSNEHDVPSLPKLLSFMPGDNVQQRSKQIDLISDDFFDELPDIIDLSNWDRSI